MDYSQFLAMKQEIALLVVFLLVFLYDTFLPRRAQGGLSGFTITVFGLFTLFGFCPHFWESASAFSEMYVTNPVMYAIKNILKRWRTDCAHPSHKVDQRRKLRPCAAVSSTSCCSSLSSACTS